MNLRGRDCHGGSNCCSINILHTACVWQLTITHFYFQAHLSVHLYAHLHSVHFLLILYINYRSIMEQLESCLWILLLITYRRCRRIFGPPCQFLSKDNFTPWVNGPPCEGYILLVGFVNNRRSLLRKLHLWFFDKPYRSTLSLQNLYISL